MHHRPPCARPEQAVLGGRGSLFKRLGRDALHCLLPFLDLRSLGALDSALTNRAEREEPWLPALADMSDNSLLCKVLANDVGSVAKWQSCLKWTTSKNISLPSELEFQDLVQATDSLLACLDNSSKVHKILSVKIVDCEGVTAAGLKALERCSGLKRFTLWKSDACEILKKLAQAHWQCFKTLERIDTNISRVDADCITAISSRCPGLKELSVSFYPGDDDDDDDDDAAATDETVKRLSAIQGLEVLELDSVEDLSVRGLSHLKNLTNLRSLEVSCCQHTDALLKVLGSAPLLRLRKLVMTDVKGLSAAGFKHFKGPGLAKLTHLDIHDDIVDENLACVSALVNLQSFRLMGGEITDQGLAHLKPLTAMQDLYIAASISDAGLVHLSQMPLVKLGFFMSQITDAGLDKLQSFFPQLKELSLLCLGRITEDGVERILGSCKKIEKVYIDHCKQISETFRDSIKARGLC